MAPSKLINSLGLCEKHQWARARVNGRRKTNMPKEKPEPKVRVFGPYPGCGKAEFIRRIESAHPFRSVLMTPQYRARMIRELSKFVDISGGLNVQLPRKSLKGLRPSARKAFQRQAQSRHSVLEALLLLQRVQDILSQVLGGSSKGK